jgi:hypothetical protein
MDGGKFKSRLFEVNTRVVSRRQNGLVGKFKMAVGDKVSIRGQVMEYTYMPTGIKWENLVWIVTGRGKSSGLLEEDQWPLILVDRLFLVSPT